MKNNKTPERDEDQRVLRIVRQALHLNPPLVVFSGSLPSIKIERN